MKRPTTRKQWQSVYDACVALRAIDDCRAYGLIEGGPVIDLERVDYFLAVGRGRGLKPSRPIDQLVLGMVAAWNEEKREEKNVTT